MEGEKETEGGKEKERERERKRERRKIKGYSGNLIEYNLFDAEHRPRNGTSIATV